MHSERQHRVSLHSERQQQPSLAGILAQPQQQNAPEKTLSVIDPLSQKISIPVSAISETRAVYREGTQSLCLLFFEGRCRLANDCNQIHADPTTVNELRVVANNLPTCCKYHGDANNHRFDRYPEWADRTLIVDGVVIPVDFVAFTIGLERSLNQSTSSDVGNRQHQQQQFDEGNAAAADGGAQKPSKSVVISPTFVCRLQAGGHCRYHDECKFIHLCREVTTQHLSRSVIPLATDLERKHKNSQAALRHGGSGGASPPSFAGQQQQQQHRHNNRHQQREYGGSPVVMVSTTGELLQQPHQVGGGVGGSSPPPPPPPPPQYVLASAAPQGIASAGNGTSSQLQQQTDLPLNLQALLPAAAKVAAPATNVAPTEAPAGSWSVTSSSVTPAPVPGPTISAGKIQQPVKFTGTGATDVTTPPPTTQESLLKSTQFQLHQASDSAAQSDVRISALVQSAAANRNTEEGLQQKLKLLSNTTTTTNGHSPASSPISQNGGGVAVVSQAILQVGQGMGESAQRDQQLKDSVLAILAELSYREQLRDELGKQMKQTAAAVSALAVANKQQQQQQQQPPPPQPENEGGSEEAVSADLLRLLAE